MRGAIDRGPVLFGQIFQLVPPVMLITMLPISIAGWGVREATMGLAFGYAGLMANEGVNISLLFGAVSFIVGAVGGVVWILSAEKAAQGAVHRGSQIAFTAIHLEVSFPTSGRMANSQLLLSLAAAAARRLLSAVRHAAIRPLLLRVALARPNARSSHRIPTPQGAGIAVDRGHAGRGRRGRSPLAGASDAEILVAVFGATLFIASRRLCR